MTRHEGEKSDVTYDDWCKLYTEHAAIHRALKAETAEELLAALQNRQGHIGRDDKHWETHDTRAKRDKFAKDLSLTIRVQTPGNAYSTKMLLTLIESILGYDERIVEYEIS